MTDLKPECRLYLLGFCRNDGVRAEAVARVVFQRQPYRAVADEMDVPEASLFRLASEFRSGLSRMIEEGKISALDLVVAE